MLDFDTSMFVAPAASLWLGFFIERGYRQGAAYNLIGKAARTGRSSKRVEKAIQKHFTKWNWVLLALAFYCAILAIIFSFHGGNVEIVIALSIGAAAVAGKCLINLTRYFIMTDKELS